jgi:hypothetical protein
MQKVKGYNHVYYRDRGMSLILKNLHVLDTSFTKVGFPSGAPVGRPTKQSDKAPLTSMSEVALIAFWNEYGTDTIPARPFLSLAYYKHLAGLKKVRDQVYLKVIKGEMSVEHALAIMGEWLAAKVKSTINEVTSPPNAPSTIRKKNAALLRRTSANKRAANPLIGTTAHPLIDTAQMRNSITHVEVVK